MVFNDMDRLITQSRFKTGTMIIVFILTLLYVTTLLNRTTSALPIDTSTVKHTLPLTPYSFEPKMISLPGGLVAMGCLEHNVNCEDDERIHKIHIAPFSIGIFEVTNLQVIPFLNAIGTHKRAQDQQPLLEIKSEDQDSHIIYQDGQYSVETGYEHYPVVEISWQGAVVYTQWLKKTTGKNYHLPTEAEWEYMARAGTSSQHPWGHPQWQDQANCDGCSGSWSDKDQLKPVGSYPPNAWGLYDVLGNVWEWTCSAYDAQYTGDENKCIDEKVDDRNLVLRGSSWFNDPWDTRLSNRADQQKWHQDYHSGFRLAMSVE